jgi:hypothetical protein
MVCAVVAVSCRIDKVCMVRVCEKLHCLCGVHQQLLHNGGEYILKLSVVRDLKL